MKLLVSTLVLVFAGLAQAGVTPNTNEIPEFKPDLGMVELLSGKLFEACHADYARVLKKSPKILPKSKPGPGGFASAS